MDRSVLSVSYRVAIAAAGVAAAAQMAVAPGKPNGAAFIALFFFACATAPLKVKLPGVDRSVSLSFAFSFAAITELPPGYAFFIVAMALLYEEVVDAKVTPPWRELAFELASASLATYGACAAYRYLKDEPGLDRLLSLGASAAAYYAVKSATVATRIGLQSGTAPWKVWNEKFFWTAPLYLLAPPAVAAIQMLQHADGAPERMLGLAMIFLGYRYVKHYFTRLHDQQDHAGRMDEIRERTIESLAVAIEAKDGATAGHLQRVKRHAIALARKLNFSETEIRTLELGAVLHDVGKVGVPDHILGKPGRLTEEEFSQLAVHTTLGAQIVEAVQFPCPVEEVVLCHHEHWDGSGYPRQLAGRQIPPLARVLTVVDCFDALVTERPYRAALPVAKAVEVMKAQRGKIFDPKILDTFLAGLPTFVETLERELEHECAQRRLAAPPALKVKQIWLPASERDDHGPRNRILERLSTSPEQLLLVYEILQVLGADLDVQQSLKKTLALLQRVIPHDQAGVFALEPQGYVLVQGEGLPDYCVSRLNLPDGEGPLAQAAAARQPVVRAGPPGLLGLGVAGRHLAGVRSTLAAPLIVDQQVIGAVALCSQAPDAFQQDQAWFLSLITGKLAAAVVSSRALQKLLFDASSDPMTSLPNARATFRRLEDEIERARREDASLAVLFLDLNQLKLVNDTHGHGVGDQFLVATAEKLKLCLRRYDFLGRVGGDEFLAVLPGIEPDSLRRKIETLQRAVAELRLAAPEGGEVGITISVGAACYPEDGADAEALIAASDQRMCADKKQAAILRSGGIPVLPHTLPAPRAGLVN